MKTIAIAALVAASVSQAGAQALPGGFVYLRDIDPTIVQDIRYAGANNFVGRPLAGYGAAECVVKREIGLALQNVQQELAKTKTVAKNVRLLSAGPRRRRHGGVVERRQGDGVRQAL